MSAETIARLNDEFHSTGAGGRIVKTPGIAALHAPDQQRIFAKLTPSAPQRSLSSAFAALLTRTARW